MTDTCLTHLFGCLRQSCCLLFARLLHHLVEDAVCILKEGVRLIVGVDPPCIQDLDHKMRISPVQHSLMSVEEMVLTRMRSLSMMVLRR